MDDRQFENAFTTAGGWFLLTQGEEIVRWQGPRGELIDLIFTKGFDKHRTGSAARVGAVLRLEAGGRLREAVEKAGASHRINLAHPQAAEMAAELLRRLP